MSGGAVSERPRKVRASWAVRLAILVSIAASGAAIVGVVLARLEAMSAPVSSVRGLRLGSRPEEVRQSRGGEGWTTSLDGTGDLLLARQDELYAFHEGALVAIDVVLPDGDPEAAGPDLVISEVSVLARDHLGSRVRVRLVSRVCPTHAAAAGELLRRAER
jgi:hypothetical protein